MNKWLALLLLSAGALQAQETEVRKNEFRIDVLSLLASSKLNLSYEYFLGNQWSTGVTLSYADSKKVNEDFDSGYRSTRPVYEVSPYVRYNLSKGKTRYYFAEAFLSANSGDFRETVLLKDENSHNYYTIEKNDYFDVAIGGSLGYKMYFNERIAAEFLVGFGTNVIDKSKSPDVMSRVGLSIGYRF